MQYLRTTIRSAFSAKRVTLARSRRLIAAMSGIGLLLVGLGSLQVAAEEAHELRGDIPSGTVIRARLDAIAEARNSFVGELARLEGEINSAIGAREDLSSAEQQVALELQALNGTARSLTLFRFISWDPASEFRVLLESSGTSSLSWRQSLIQHHLISVDQILVRLRELQAQASEAVLDVVYRTEELRREVDWIQQQLLDQDLAEEEARRLLVLAEAWDRAEIAIAEGDYGFAPRQKWEALRFCESSDNYQAVSPGRVYRGAYQFDSRTWISMGGRGDPAAAPSEEQDARARELFARRGADPWPICGRYLR